MERVLRLWAAELGRLPHDGAPGPVSFAPWLWALEGRVRAHG